LSDRSLADVIRPLEWVTSAPSTVPPGDNQVLLWYLNRSQIPLHEKWLAADEIERALRMKPERRDEFVSGRNALRALMASFLGREPAAIPIRISYRGKPYLDGLSVEFSFSHCNGHLLLGVARQPLGIDLERCRRRANLMPIARRILDSGACAQLEASDASRRESLFYRYWTAHEAVQKLRGDGLFGKRHLPACVTSLTLTDFKAAVACPLAEPEFSMHEALPDL
jgi:4'-phosphopantetheinyl transferase